MKKLPYIIECKSTYPFFETIAAFNCEQAAKAYADECYDANHNFDYHVKKGKTLVASWYRA